MRSSYLYKAVSGNSGETGSPKRCTVVVGASWSSQACGTSEATEYFHTFCLVSEHLSILQKHL